MEVTPVLIQLFITTSVMQLREVIVIPFRMSLMQCLFIGKVLCEDFEIHMLNFCSEIGIHMHILNGFRCGKKFRVASRESMGGMAIFPIDRWDKNRMDRFVAFITRSLVKPGKRGWSH